MRLRASSLTMALLSLGLGVSGPVLSTSRASAAAVDEVVVEGRGFGHGEGLSQWGALGYAVDHGWDWTQILAHYYGGTTRSTVDPASPIGVRLNDHDGLVRHAVVRSAGGLAVSAAGAVAAPTVRYSAVTIIESAPGIYRMWGLATGAGCPASFTPADYDAAGSGWTLIHGGIAASTANRITIATPEVNTGSAAATDLLGLCEATGAVTKYRGRIDVLDAADGGNRVVNVVAVDDYLRGVVPREIIASWAGNGGGRGAHALRAQAVAARTYAMAESRYDYAQTCDDGNCQVYGGAAVIPAGSTATTVREDFRSDAAVVATAGVVLRTAAGGLAYTQFSSSSGGHTAGRNFPAVVDVGDATPSNPYHSWTTTVTAAMIEAAYPTIGQFASIEVAQRNGLGEWGGRVVSVRVKGSSGSVTVSGAQLRFALGLRSDWFNVIPGCIGPTGRPLAATAGTFQAVTPLRIVDTRGGLGGTRLPGDCRLVIPIRSLANVPDTAVAVSINVTAVDAGRPGFLSVYPCSAGRPVTSNLNTRPGPPVANLAVVSLDVNGDVCVFAQPSTDVVIDLLGWYGPAGRGFAARNPERLVDTRLRPAGAVAGGSELVVDLAGRVGPAIAVALNVTATGAANQGFVTVYPCGSPRPLASNLNLVPGRDLANQVNVATGASATVCVYSQATTHLVVDLLGTYDAAASLRPSAPTRVHDSRESGSPVASGQTLRVGVPTLGVAVLNLTSTQAAAAGFVTAHDCAVGRPPTSNLNFTPGVDVANVVLSAASSGEVCLFVSQSTHVVVDVLGSFS